MRGSRKYLYSESGFSFIATALKKAVFEKVTGDSADLFVRGTDIISVSPQTQGLHEFDVTVFIQSCADEGMSDFFIDIGANIGLIACQNGNEFKRVICFEPNPLCVHILKANTEIALESSKVTIHEFGLGERDEELDLLIPKHNWGGAFVRSDENAYSDGNLAAKDGFSEIDLRNYAKARVRIRSAESCLQQVFESLAEEGLKNGVVKIDVEGMELIVLKGLSQALPDDMKLTVVFENWDVNLDSGKVEEYFTSRSISLEKLGQELPYKKRWPAPLKGLAALIGRRKVFVGDLREATDPCGDIVLRID